MKLRKSEINESTIEVSQCCSTETSTAKQEEPCCNQPSDGSSCCDKTESKEANSEKTGCC